MRVILATGIIADRPTANGNLYPREVIERAVHEFNLNAKNRPNLGGIIDKKHIQRVERVTHETLSLFINESGMMCAEIRLLDPKVIDSLKKGAGFIARPLLSIPSFIDNGSKPLTISIINRIVRVLLERSDG